jgi:AcrR family transcriptional regulator
MVIKEEIREQIIEAARQIFSRFGFKKTTMDEIAQSVSKGKSSIYYYYPGKEDIYKAVIEKESSMLRDEIFNAISQVSDPVDKLKKYVAVRMYSFQKMVNFYDAITNEFLTHLDFINKMREKYDKEEMRAVEDILKEGVSVEEFVIDNTELAAIAIVTAMKGLEVPLLKYKDQLSLEERIDSLLNVLFFGIVKR